MINFRTNDIKIVDITELHANDYNPNRMPTSEMQLLKDSIMKYGFVFPIIATWDEEMGKYRIIDGYHRYETLKRIGSDKVSIIDMGLDYHECVQLTVLMNRIKGLHKVEAMSELVEALNDMGMEDEEIKENLGMEDEEYLRLKQQLGIAHAFKDHNYSQSWKAEEK